MSKMRLSDNFSMLLKIAWISNALYLLSNFNILSAVFCRTLCNRAVCCCSVSVCILSAVFCRTLCNLAVCPQPIKNIVTTTSFARTCESRITSFNVLRPGSHVRHKYRCKRKKIHVYTAIAQMQTQAPTQKKKMENLSFSSTCICACVCLHFTRVNRGNATQGKIKQQQQQQQQKQVTWHHGQPRPPSWKNTSTAPAYLTFLAFAFDA